MENENKNRIKKIHTSPSNTKWFLLLGIVILLLSPVVYFIAKTIMCSGCREIGCAFCDLGAFLLGGLILLFGIIMVVVSCRGFKRPTSAKLILAKVIRWFLIIILATIGMFSAYDAVLRFQNGGTINVVSIIITAVSIIGAVFLYSTRKR